MISIDAARTSSSDPLLRRPMWPTIPPDRGTGQEFLVVRVRFMPTVLALEDLRLSPTASLFEGGDQIPVSSFVTTYERGQSVGLHTHPYAELFVVLDGTG